MDITDRESLYKIVVARDRRYDGRFYCGVKTTGIYCRPICPARPKLENLTFYRSAAEAEGAGFRACRRCRPDLAPNSAAWSGTAAVVGRALSLISRGEAGGDGDKLDRLAERLGISDRHLRRLFEEHLGASPVEIAASKRLHLAKHLLTHSRLPVTEVAFASGYRSIRRFNEAFKAKFREAPSRLRKSGGGKRGGDFITVELPVVAPYDWAHIYEFLRHHAQIGVESFTETSAAGSYRRNITLGGRYLGAFELRFDERRSQLVARIAMADSAPLREVIERIRDLFDARLNPHFHLPDLIPDDAVAEIYRANLGIRIPGAWDSYETAVCIILGQLVSVEQAQKKVAKLIALFGTKVAHPHFAECSQMFPRPEVLAGASLREIGLTRTRERAIQELSRQVHEGEIDLSRTANIEQTRAELLAIPGIGPWTVEMIAMRCLGDANAFPKTDLIVKRAIEHHQSQKGDWSPWNAYIALTLWKKYARLLSKKGSPRKAAETQKAKPRPKSKASPSPSKARSGWSRSRPTKKP